MLEKVANDAVGAEILLILETREERKTRASEAVMFNSGNSRRYKALWPCAKPVTACFSFESVAVKALP